MTVAERQIDEAERGATCALAAVPGIGPQSLQLLLTAFGSLAAAVSAGPAKLSAAPGLRTDGARALLASGDLVARGESILQLARQIGARVLLAGEPDYPPRLAAAEQRPPVLYVLAEQLPWADARRPAVAVVGSRQADEYGLIQSRRVASLVCRSGGDLYSGGAYGVDEAAHRQVLELGGRTVAVVGTGLCNTYPRSHAVLFSDIARSGALVSEFPPDAGGQRSHFPQRNRTLAGLSDAVVLVRGQEGSGALGTCEAATRLQRPVFAVPGRLDEPDAWAPNSLLSAGTARALVTGSELWNVLGGASSTGLASPAPAEMSDPRAMVPERPMASLEGPARSLYAALGPAPRHVDALASEAGVAASEALAGLLELELAGLCVARPGMYFARR